MKKLQHNVFRQLAFTVLLISFTSLPAWATHFRYGNVQWTNTSGNTVTFKIQQAWRWSYFGNPALNSVVDIAAADGAVPLDFGDGSAVDISLTITSINAAEDWFFGEVTYTHAYSQPGIYDVSFQGCCRISILQNNQDESFRVHTSVDVGNGANSTVSTVSPIVDMIVGNPSASFIIPTIDPDGHTLTFRLANADEAAGTGNSYEQPTGLSVNSSTGVVSFSTVGKTVGDLYTTQVIISNGVSEIAVDFIIRIVDAPAGTPPYFVYPPTPADNSTLNVNVGQLLSFNVKAQDDDAGSSVTLTIVGLPLGASTTPDLPATDQPVTTQFNWTPVVADAGTYILTFKATDNDGASVLTTVNIVVNTVCDPNFSCSVGVSPSTTVTGQNPNTIYLGFGAQTVKLTASSSGGNGGNTYSWSTGATTSSIKVSPTTTTTYTVTITDAAKCTTTCAVTIYVVDVRCGKKNNRISICHKNCPMCVLVCRVPIHLRHGDKLGACPVENSLITQSATQMVTKETVITQAKVFPNPAKNYLVLQMQQDKNTMNANIRISDITGRVVINARSNNQSQQTIDVSKLSNGTYILQIMNETGKIIVNTKFIMLK
jgi:hypothetical protein